MAQAGARMSFASLLTDTVQIYREPDPATVRSSLGHVPSLPSPIGAAPTGKNARPAQNWAGQIQDSGPGEQENRTRTWLLSSSLLGVAARDVLKVIAGPHTGYKLRVVGEPELAQDSNSVHHIEVNVEVWAGELFEDAT